MEKETQHTAEDFLALIRKSKRGKFKVYIGMCAGVGKSYRMLQEAHTLLKNGIDEFDLLDQKTEISLVDINRSALIK